MRTFKLLSLVIVLTMMLSACTTAPAAAPSAAPAAPAAGTEAAAAAPAGGDLKLAILAPLSGPVPTFGVSTRDGALLAIDEWNAKGGVNGQKIVPVVEDSQCTPDPAVNAANKVIDQDGVKYIIGEVCSKASLPVSEIANAKGVIMISPTSTASSVTVNADGSTKEYVYRACFTDPFQGKVIAESIAMKMLGAKTAFIMLDQANDYTVGLSDGFEKAYVAAGGKIVGKESYTSQDTDFSTILAKIAEVKPDVVLLPDYYNIVNLVTKQAKEKGITTTFVGGDGWDSADLDKAAAAGGYYTNHYSPEDPRPEVQNFVKAYGEKYKDDSGKPKTPDALATLAYDATNLLLNGITEAGTADTAKVKDALNAIKFSGVSGNISFDAQHNPIKGATILEVTPDAIKFREVANP